MTEDNPEILTKTLNGTVVHASHHGILKDGMWPYTRLRFHIRLDDQKLAVVENTSYDYLPSRPSQKKTFGPSDLYNGKDNGVGHRVRLTVAFSEAGGHDRLTKLEDLGIDADFRNETFRDRGFVDSFFGDFTGNKLLIR